MAFTGVYTCTIGDHRFSVGCGPFYEMAGNSYMALAQVRITSPVADGTPWVHPIHYVHDQDVVDAAAAAFMAGEVTIGIGLLLAGTRYEEIFLAEMPQPPSQGVYR